MIAPSKLKRTRHNALPSWHPDQNALRIVADFGVGIEEFPSESVQGIVIQRKLPLEGPIGHAASLVQQSQHLIHHRDEVHLLSSFGCAGRRACGRLLPGCLQRQTRQKLPRVRGEGARLRHLHGSGRRSPAQWRQERRSACSLRYSLIIWAISSSSSFGSLSLGGSFAWTRSSTAITRSQAAVRSTTVLGVSTILSCSIVASSISPTARCSAWRSSAGRVI